MDHLYAVTRSTASPCRFSTMIRPQWQLGCDGSPVAGVVHGPVDMYADGYPGGTCNAQGKITRSNGAPDWGYYGIGGAKGGASASPDTPGS
jgi:hypothetical protein